MNMHIIFSEVRLVRHLTYLFGFKSCFIKKTKKLYEFTLVLNLVEVLRNSFRVSSVTHIGGKITHLNPRNITITIYGQTKLSTLPSKDDGT